MSHTCFIIKQLKKTFFLGGGGGGGKEVANLPHLTSPLPLSRRCLAGQTVLVTDIETSHSLSISGNKNSVAHANAFLKKVKCLNNKITWY